jgi:hypothetical protein
LANAAIESQSRLGAAGRRKSSPGSWPVVFTTACRPCAREIPKHERTTRVRAVATGTKTASTPIALRRGLSPPRVSSQRILRRRLTRPSRSLFLRRLEPRPRSHSWHTSSSCY